MIDNKKFHPILYTGYQITDDIEIKKFIWKSDNVEEYELSDGRYLSLSMGKADNSKMFVMGGKALYYTVNESSKAIPESPVVEIVDDIESVDFQPEEDHVSGFDSVAGMDELKKTLLNDVIKPIKESAKYEKFKIKPPNGILLYGPPGCGKTFIARKLGEELGMSFIETKHSDFASIYVHGATEKIGKVFKRAKQNRPCILFIDEIDGLLPKRTSLGGSSDHKHEEVNEFLMQLNKIGEQQVIVIAASNRPEQIDEAVLRTGRIDKIIYVSPPDKNALIELFQLYLKDRPISDDINMSELADKTLGSSCSDIEYICDEAARDAVENNADMITLAVIDAVISQTKPSISDGMKRQYENFAKMGSRLFDDVEKKTKPIGFVTS